MGYLQEYYEVNETQNEDLILEWESKSIQESINDWALDKYKKVVMEEFGFDDIFDNDIFEYLVREQLMSCAICESSGVLFDWKTENTSAVGNEYLDVHRIIHENDNVDEIQKSIDSNTLHFYKCKVLENIDIETTKILEKNLDLLDTLVEEKLFECAVYDSNKVTFNWNNDAVKSIVSDFQEIEKYFDEKEQTDEFMNMIKSLLNNNDLKDCK